MSLVYGPYQIIQAKFKLPSYDEKNTIQMQSSFHSKNAIKRVCQRVKNLRPGNYVANYLCQGLRSWGQFRKNKVFHEKKPKHLFVCVFGVFQYSHMHN